MERADLPAETGTEMIHGEIRKVLPSLPPQANEQARVASVLAIEVVARSIGGRTIQAIQAQRTQSARGSTTG